MCPAMMSLKPSKVKETVMIALNFHELKFIMKVYTISLVHRRLVSLLVI